MLCCCVCVVHGSQGVGQWPCSSSRQPSYWVMDCRCLCDGSQELAAALRGCHWLGCGLSLCMYVCEAATARELAAVLRVRRWMGNGFSLLVCVCVMAARELAAALRGCQWLGCGLSLRMYVCEAAAAMGLAAAFCGSKVIGRKIVTACVCLRQVASNTQLDRQLG